MKKTLLFTKTSKLALALLVLCLSVNLGFSQTNLIKNGTMQEHTSDTDDNADSFDMTPNGSIKDESGATVDSPYKYDDPDNLSGWNNSALDSWLDDFFSDDSEQPGSSSDGNYDYVNDVKTRGLKLSEASRRLYQLVQVTQGVEYTFSIDSRSEADNTSWEVFILNTEIADEVGINANGENDVAVDAYYEVTNDYNSSKPSSSTMTFTTTTFTFTASTNQVVVYVRALDATGSTETWYDNAMLYDASTASTEDNELSRSFSVYPNPASGVLFIKSNKFDVSNVRLFNVMGQKILDHGKLSKDQLDISGVSKGIYILKVTSDSRSFSQKIIIE